MASMQRKTGSKGLDALRRANPRHEEGFEETTAKSTPLLSAILTDRESGTSRGSATPRRRERGYRTLGLSAAAAVVVLAGAITAVMLFAGGPSGITQITPAQAAEAVKQAAADTATAGRSGVIETVLAGMISANDGAQAAYGAEPEMTEGALNTIIFTWNGDDLIIAGEGDWTGAYELRYVDGRFYEKGYHVPDSQDWYHCTDFDNGGGDDPGPDAAYEAFIPAEWLESYRSALVGSGLRGLIENVSGLTVVSSVDGGQVYSGTLPADGLSTNALGLYGFPFAGQPLDKLGALDPTYPVSVEIVVDSDGLIGQATLGYELEGNPFTYTVRYSRLGSGPTIIAPDAEQTVTTDRVP